MTITRGTARRKSHAKAWFPSSRSTALLVLIAVSLVYIAPLLWMSLTSVKTLFEASSWPLQWIPSRFSTHAYEEITRPGTDTPVLRWFVNSLFAAMAQAVLIVGTAAPAAYALARLEFPGKKLLFWGIIATLFIPPIIFLTPNYIIVDSFGWLNTLWAVIVPGAAGAFGVFLMRQFFIGLPPELEEAALVDGANRFQVFMRIVLPLSKPALATLFVLSFLSNWNDFLWPLYVLFSPETLTLPPGLAKLQSTYFTDYPVIMAGAVFASIPVIILFIFAQRYVIEGVARSGLKG